MTGRTWPTTSQRPSRARHVQQEVGEAEVGQHPPLAHQPLEVGDVVPLEVGVLRERGRRRWPSVDQSAPTRHGPSGTVSASSRSAEPDRGRPRSLMSSSRYGTVTSHVRGRPPARRAARPRAWPRPGSWGSSRPPRPAPAAPASGAADRRDRARRRPGRRRPPQQAAAIASGAVAQQVAGSTLFSTTAPRCSLRRCSAWPRRTRPRAAGAASSVRDHAERRAAVAQELAPPRGPG